MKLFTLITVLCLFCLASSFSQGTANGEARKFDEFEYDPFGETTKARLKTFGKKVSEQPNARAYIIAYGSDVYRYGDLKASQSASYAGFEADGNDIYKDRESGRYVLIDGGYRTKPMIELWIVPPGASPPIATPTVRREDVAFCPLITVSSPLIMWRADKPLEFAAWVREEVTGVVPKFRWTVSAGEVLDGQGTQKIKVRLRTPHYEPVTATVEVIGYSQRCETVVSETSPEKLVEVPLKFDEFGNLNCESEWARLDNYAVFLQSDEELQAHIIFYGAKFYDFYGKPRKRLARRGEAAQRAARMIAYLVNSRGIDADRITLANGGFRDEWSAELYLVPRGQKPPAATPTVSPADMKFRRGKVGKNEHGCGDLG